VTVLAAVAALFSLLSLACFFANRAAFPRLPRANDRPEWPPVSIVVPARNEERDIESAVRSHLESDYPDLEVVVVDDRSDDGTREILARLAEGDRRIRIVAGEEPPPGWLGKPHALRQGAGHARGEWLLFADADVVYAPDALRRAMDDALRRELALLCLLPRLSARGFWENVLMPNLYATMLLGPGFLAAKPRFRGIAVGAGAGNLVRRPAYDAAGGHEALRSAVIDDVGLAIAVKRAGCRVGAALCVDSVSVRMYRGFREIAEGFSKNLAYVFPRPSALAAAYLAVFAVAIVPWVALAVPAPVPARGFAALAIVLTLVGRFAVARRTRSPLWSGLFHPVMVAVWSGIAVRSLYRRVVTRKIAWRGRTTSAPP